MIAPMLPDSPAVTKCSACESFFWLDDVAAVGKLEPMARVQRQDPDEWKETRDITGLTEEENLDALSAGLGSTRERELELRIKAWWTANDQRRIGGSASMTPISPRMTTNLGSLFELLDERNPDGRLMKAEIARELGNFGQAAQLLVQEFDDPQREAIATFLRSLCEEGTRDVRQIELG